MRFEPIDGKHFAEFHAGFKGDTSDTFRVCSKCGGACEFNKIGTLMPGEREYMAACAELSVDEFSSRYLDILLMDDGMELDVLRLINGCPFLDRKTGACGCREFKVVLCEIYPIGFYVEGGQVHFSIDDWCPLSDTPRFRREFSEIGMPAVKKLPVPVEWYEHVARYDDLYFDYVSLEKARGDRSILQRITLADLLSHQQAGNKCGPKERFHPDEKVVPFSFTPLVTISRRQRIRKG